MNVAFFTHSTKLQGAPLYLLWLAERYRQAGHHCVLFGPRRGELSALCRERGIRWKTVRGLGRRPLTPGTRRFLECAPPDLIFVNTVTVHRLLPGLRASFPEARIGWIIHESQREEYCSMPGGPGAGAFRIPDKTIFCSDRTRALYADLDPGNAVTIHPGIDTHAVDAHRAQYSRAQLRSAYGVPHDAFVFLHVGTLTHRKGQMEFARAAVRVARQTGNANLLFVMVGESVRGERAYRAEITRLIRAEGMERHFLQVPATAGVFDWYGLADAFVCSSFVESFPLVNLEAMAFCLPVISSDTYGTADQIGHGNSGLLVPPGQVEPLAAAMRRLLEDAGLRAELGAEAGARVRERFTLGRMADRYREEFPEPERAPAPKPPGAAYGLFFLGKRLWVLAGKPAPRFIRGLRYGLLARRWPVLPGKTSAPATPSARRAVETAGTAPVAVIIPCHNYAQFLVDAVRSVLAQQVKPAEIVIVDDASTDTTPAVAAGMEKYGVRYIRGEWSAVGEARNAGMRATVSEYLVFLDADNILHPDYIRNGVEALASSPGAGVAYSDLQFFGNTRWRYVPPREFDWFRFDTENLIDAGAMVRREALEQAGGWSHGRNQDGDWITWRRILALGWKPVRSEGTFYYRKHGGNMHLALAESQTYPGRSGLEEEPVTLCVALSGRWWAWPLMAKFLERQTFPRDRIRLVLLDTSQNPAFGEMVRAWTGTCGYKGVTHLCETVGPKGLAQMPRGDPATAQAVSHACASIYNRFARLCQTALCLFVEDDVVPPEDVLHRLLSRLDIPVIAVGGAYMHRQRAAPVAWNWRKDGLPEDIPVGSGAARVGGTGFGCLLVRGELLRRTVFRSGPPRYNFDHNFFEENVLRAGRTVLVDWDCRCRHYHSPDAWSDVP